MFSLTTPTNRDCQPRRPDRGFLAYTPPKEVPVSPGAEMNGPVRPRFGALGLWQTDRVIKRRADGSAGDADYGVIGSSYSHYRRPDPRIEQAIWAALGHATTVLNVGAGAGSYEPSDRETTAVEPSESTRQQRPATLATAINATAERLPFADSSFDASMSTGVPCVETLDSGTSGQICHHLKELASAGWLVSGKRGTHEVPPSRIVPLLAILVAAGTPG